MPRNLVIGGCDAAFLVKCFGTPLYAYDEQALRANCRRYTSAFRRHYPRPVRISYAAKAFWCLAMARLIKEEGLCADVASAGELYTALKAGIPGERLYLHGNCKTPEEIEMAMNAHVHRIVVDNEGELELIENLARKRRMRASLLLRVTLGVEASTHHAIKTGHWDTKFGLYEKGGAALRTAQKALNSPHLALHGFHAHIGSQIFHLDNYAGLIQSAFAFLAQVKTKTGFEARELDLGPMGSSIDMVQLENCLWGQRGQVLKTEKLLSASQFFSQGRKL